MSDPQTPPESPSENNASRRRKGIYLLPNLLTTAALFSGFYAIVAAIDGDFVAAAIAIYVSIILDGLDGRVARMTSTESDFGKEYDSLSDMVSFGLAPAVVIYQWGVARLAEYGMAWGRLGWLAAFVYAVAAAMRLARFNARAAGSDKRFFEGLPSPSAAALVAGLVWLGTVQNLDGLPALVTGFVITVAAGLFMVSVFRYYSFKDLNLRGPVRFTNLLLIPAVFIVISLNPPVVLFAGFFLYALSGPVLWLWMWRRRRRRSSDGGAVATGQSTQGAVADGQAAAGAEDEGGGGAVTGASDAGRAAGHGAEPEAGEPDPDEVGERRADAARRR